MRFRWFKRELDEKFCEDLINASEICVSLTMRNGLIFVRSISRFMCVAKLKYRLVAVTISKRNLRRGIGKVCRPKNGCLQIVKRYIKYGRVYACGLCHNVTTTTMHLILRIRTLTSSVCNCVKNTQLSRPYVRKHSAPWHIGVFSYVHLHNVNIVLTDVSNRVHLSPTQRSLVYFPTVNRGLFRTERTTPFPNPFTSNTSIHLQSVRKSNLPNFIVVAANCYIPAIKPLYSQPHWATARLRVSTCPIAQRWTSIAGLSLINCRSFVLVVSRNATGH